jgi:anti-sigma factor RsiW
MMTCADINRLVTDYLDGTMPVVQRMRFAVHLALCSHCRRFVRQQRAAIAATGQLALHDVPPEVRDELLHVFREWKRNRD